MHILIDGYNAAHKIPSVAAYFKESLEKVRNRLIDHLVLWNSSGGKGGEITVVFDGKTDETFCSPSRIKGIRVVFTETGEEADDRIADMISLAKDPAKISVISDDNKIANACRSYGVKIHPVSFLNLPQNRKKAAGNDYKPGGMAMDAITRELMKKWVGEKR